GVKRVLVANRGEIAVRVMATLRECGLESVAVHSDIDAGAMHVLAADTAVAIGAAPPGESYLLTERILEAARATGADAVHPGYGFLAENAAFARAVEEAGLTFLGPRPETIDLLGDKRRAREVARKAGVPVVPGWEGDASDRDGAAAAADKMGWPVIVKAALGGGGKGMSRIRERSALNAALEGAERLAQASFGKADVYLEKAIDEPRHIEVQILGDGEGEVVHLFERECSLQRRHQKIIEESPSPVLKEETRARLTEAAVRIGKEVGYRSAGTCEFLLDPDGEFYFLEVNARIQVEHPVTELLTGRDLVAAQVRVARGEGIGFKQEDITARGSAVEARLYAEDPDTGFLPQAGHLLRVQFPEDPWLRVDAGVRTGDDVSPHYDPMIAKVIAFGEDRATAWRRLHSALQRTVIHGPVNNLAFLRELTARPDVVAGDFHTESIETSLLPEFRSAPDEAAENLMLGAAAVADAFGWAADGTDVPAGGGEAARLPEPFDTLTGWRHAGLGEGR
ncbi:MAG: ATP-grasp domain-containing protein, partial [Gemmatimonadetes bacterium]|nr:ATP-grasp domain-containing protein [Gemmatimonadota bacterium]